MSDIARGLCAGAAAGTAATVPMTAAMEGLRRLLPPDERDPIPPRQIMERATAAAGVADEMTEGQKDVATAAVHFGFGAGAGAVYGLVAPHLPGGPVTRGVAYGLAVWAGSYLGWLPAVGLYKRPEEEPPERHGKMILSHAVWGAALGLIHQALAGDKDTENGNGEARRDRLSSPEALAAARATAV